MRKTRNGSFGPRKSLKSESMPRVKTSLNEVPGAAGGAFAQSQTHCMRKAAGAWGAWGEGLGVGWKPQKPLWRASAVEGRCRHGGLSWLAVSAEDWVLLWEGDWPGPTLELGE